MRNFFYILSIVLLGSCMSPKEQMNRETHFNGGWMFYRGVAEGARLPDFDDSGWRSVDLPHDYSIEDLPFQKEDSTIGPFTRESVGGSSTGFVVGGTAWYRKHFQLGKEDQGKVIQVLFDGVYMNSDVWINGHHLGNHPYGYTPFSYDLTPFLHAPGEENVIAVEVKNEGANSRWYSGSGIYRNVTLIRTNPVYMTVWGNYIATPEVSLERALVDIQTEVVNSSGKEKEITVNVYVTDVSGDQVAMAEKAITLDKNEKGTVHQKLLINAPNLWSPESPELYAARIQVLENGNELDCRVEKFGVRSIGFSPEKGFLINGERLLLKGACLHHDNGMLGSVAFKTAEFRRVRTMKEHGFNAIRTSHNPPSAFFLEACDQLGMLVIDEAFDQWQRPKNKDDYNLYFDRWWERDMEAMLLRDRNHPSVIMWSYGNEINERADSSGLEIAKMLVAKIHEMDPSRPSTQAICEFWDHPGRDWSATAPAFAIMDVQGYNYRWDRYEDDHKNHPERVMFGSESTPKEALDNWSMVEKHPYIIGDFVWTGMDYFGEAGIGRTRYSDSDQEAWMGLPGWPWFNAWCGDIDIMGNKKPQFLYREVVWRQSELEVLVHAPVPKGKYEHSSYWGWPDELPHWNWDGNEGVPLQVSVYTRCEQVRLELNSQVIGTRQVSEQSRLTAVFQVPYQAGELLAIGLNGGKEVCRKSLKTTGTPYRLRITAEEETVRASSGELAYFNIDVLDQEGNLVPTAELLVEFSIAGRCKIQAAGNANPTGMHGFQSPATNTFRGRCQLIVRSCESGETIRVKAKSEGLVSAESVVQLSR